MLRLITQKLLLLGILVTATASRKEADLVLALSRESMVQVHGKTNVNKFCCQGQPLESLGPMLADIHPRNGKVFFEGRGFRVKAGELDCGNRIMNKDLYATLNGSEHPYVRFVLLSLDFKPHMESADGVCRVKLDVAGIERMTEANFEYLLLDDALFLFGKVPLRFSDFDLTPPSKMAGMIRVEQEFEVEFQLYFRPQ